ncbi:MAG: adenylate/guanylate cyclase domain-containing protein, partial [Desulfobacterales bacterium]
NFSANISAAKGNTEIKTDGKKIDIPPEKPSETITVRDRRTVTPLPRDTTDSGSLTLTIDEIQFPAFLVNPNLEIEWINQVAEDQIFNRPVGKIAEQESRNLFKLFFGWEFSTQVQNREKVIAQHLPFVKSKLPRDHIPHLYPGIGESEVQFLEKVYDDESVFPGGSAHSAPLDIVAKDGTVASYQVHSMIFREGIFFVYVPADKMLNDIMEMFSQRGRIIKELLEHRMPSQISLCVVVADLQDSVRISAELLPEEYFELINQLWKTLQVSFDKYGGLYGKHAGDGMLYYFIKKPGSDYVKSALSCAMEIKERMKEFSNEWKLRKGWLNDLYMNIGINEGQEFFGTIRSSAHVEFTALGDSINYAGRLSDFSRYGSIWTTKNVINKLDREAMAHIRFGVHRKQHDREILIEDSFSRVMDLLDDDEMRKESSKFLDIATLPVTEILSGDPESLAARPLDREA